MAIIKEHYLDRPFVCMHVVQLSLVKVMEQVQQKESCKILIYGNEDSAA